MRTIEVALLADEAVEIAQPKVYMGEHLAAELAVTLPERLLAGFDYYTLCFDLMDSGRQACTANIYPGAAPAEEGGASAWLAGGVLHCTLPRALTAGSWLRCQVAACVQAEGDCVRMDKSAPFIISFEGGNPADAGLLTPYTAGEVERVLAELDALKSNLVVDWDAMSDALGGILREGMDVAMGGCNTGALTVESDGQLLPVEPGVLWRLEFAPGVSQATLVLDDSGAAAGYAPEFRLRVTPPETGAPTLSLCYVDGQAVTLPDHFQFRAGRCYELNVLDHVALAASWGVAA
ncbi:MAG: hypothetical protein LBS96_05510 [Oscillospiraceae bacterium]|jgi:hypothetical protein|nr:hypothetical protein [Oscillospiraceae bacterium]